MAKKRRGYAARPNRLPPPAAVVDAARPPASFWRPAVVGWIAAGLLARLAISAVSYGTGDAEMFSRFGAEVQLAGLTNAYRFDPYLNHPPIPILWAWATQSLTDGGLAFTFLFKLPFILGEAAVACLLWRTWRDRAATGPVPAAAAAAVGYALSLCAILASGYHCNTDSAYAGLSLLSVWLLDRRRPLAAGLALAAAVNVKLIPVILVPGLLLSIRDRRSAARFLAGLAVGVVPFVPVLWAAGPSFYRNAVAYGSNLEKWGVALFLLPAGDMPPADLPPAAMAYYRYARFPMLALVVAWAVVARVRRAWDRYEVAAVTYGLFLVLASGFGAQYTAIVLPLMYAVRPAIGHAYGAAAGFFIAAVYFVTLNDAFPLHSQFYGNFFPFPTQWLGMVPWAMLIGFVAYVVARGWRRPAMLDAAGQLPTAPSVSRT